MANINVKN